MTKVETPITLLQQQDPQSVKIYFLIDSKLYAVYKRFDTQLKLLDHVWFRSRQCSVLWFRSSQTVYSLVTELAKLFLGLFAVFWDLWRTWVSISYLFGKCSPFLAFVKRKMGADWCKSVGVLLLSIILIDRVRIQKSLLTMISENLASLMATDPHKDCLYCNYCPHKNRPIIDRSRNAPERKTNSYSSNNIWPGVSDGNVSGIW